MKNVDLEQELITTREQEKQFAIESYEEFLAEFPTEMACLEELYRLAGVEKKCSYCHGPDLELSNNGRNGICFRCRKKTWFTAGTFLDRIKKPMPRLAAIKLIARGAVLTSTLLSSLAQISQGSAHGVLQWVRFAIQAYVLQDSAVVHSRHFSSVFCKRSSETPAGKHPVAEQDAMEVAEQDAMEVAEQDAMEVAEQDAMELDESPAGPITQGVLVEEHLQTQSPATFTADLAPSNVETKEQKQYSGANDIRILQFLSDEPVHFDFLYNQVQGEVSELNVSLLLLELDGKVNRLPGDSYTRVKPKPKISMPKGDTMLSIRRFLDFIMEHFAGISRKYLQSYIAAYWCYFATTRMSLEVGFPNCLSRLKATNSKTRTVVTPLWVNYSC